MSSGPPAQPRNSMIASVLWNWTGTAVSLGAAFILTPFMIGRLGEDAYGAWALAFALIEYFWIVDLGFRSATIKYSAHYRALDDRTRLNEVINTGLAYYAVVAALVLAATFALVPFTGKLFPLMQADLRRQFETLVLIVGASWSLGAVFIVFQACLEGFQRFDLVSRIFIITTAVRTIGIATLLAKGYGMTALGLVVLASQALGYLLSFLFFRRLHSGFKLSTRLVRRDIGKEMAGYGVHTFLASIAGQLLNQTAPLLIGRYRPSAFVGYYNVPLRVLNYAGVELAARVAVVTGARSAELSAREDKPSIGRLAALSNRYCLTLFMPLAIFLLLFGEQFLRVWIRPASVGESYAIHSAPLILPFVLGIGLSAVAQFNSSSILYGLGEHKWYARGLILEALLAVVSFFVLVRSSGILAVAWAGAALMILNRGLWTSWLLCRSLSIPWAGFLRSVYLPPLACAIPPVLLLVAARAVGLTGQDWMQLMIAALIAGVFYFAPAFWLCISPEHRERVLAWLLRRGAAGPQTSDSILTK